MGRRASPYGTPAGLIRLLAPDRIARPGVLGAVPALWPARGRSDRTPVAERGRALDQAAADPHDAVAAHDRVDRVVVQAERLAVRARDLRTREVVPAALARRMAMDHADRATPAGTLTGLLGDDARGRGLLGLDVGRCDPLHDDHPGLHLAAHAAHELGRERPDLRHHEAPRLIRQDNPTGAVSA